MRLAANGMISLDLSREDEVCLVPAEWNGRYPKTTGPQRIMKLSEQQNHRCCYCGVHTWCKHYGEDGPWNTMATVEHIIPRHHGGTNRRGNIVMACSECNSRRDRENPFIFMLERTGRLDLELEPLEGDDDDHTST